MKRLPSISTRLDALDWRGLAALGLALGLGAGLIGVLVLDSPWSLPAWGLLLAALARLGWDAEPRLTRPLVEPRAPPVRLPRPVRDGPFVMVELPGGDFFMGSPDSDDLAYPSEKPRHRVRVSGFRIARTPVTLGLYREVMGQDPTKGDPDLPATGVSWFDAIEFCNRLSRRQGYRPGYRQRGLWRWRRWHCDWRADGYRLPTEAQWERACRAGTTTRFSFGDDPALLDDFAWYDKNSNGEPHPVGTRRPNPWGLFDLHGNVWEWCWDWYGPYRVGSRTDPHGPARGRGRVLRGGSFFGPPEVLRSSVRFGVQPERQDRDVGFRCVRVASPQP